ncbi:MAG: hypothetical protein U9O89_06335 [Thermoproteota archaeon]|nr:hypothetical protein [Thermoproteota archaeon]
MSKELHPYVIFLPAKRKQNVLRAIFGSKIPVDILQFSINQGISKKIYQKDLIEQFDYSNKTVIGYLKTLTDAEILEGDMEKTKRDSRTVWVKYYVLSDLGKWFALLLTPEQSLSRDEKVKLIRSIFRTYVRWVKSFSEKLGVGKKVIQEIFREEMRET